ncbi:MAG: hypothetical protein R2761_23785 [Acidimicrobiales bacterium]
MKGATGNGRRWALDALVVLAVAVPFGPLVLQALADRWQGRALVPQALGWRGIRLAADDPILVRAVGASLAVGAVVAALAVIVAWPAARYLAQTRSRVGWALLASPLLMPPLVLGDGLAAWLPAIGLAGGYAAIVVAHLPGSIAYAALALVPAFGPELDELDASAAVLGASPVRRLAGIIVPAVRRHLMLALALAFTVSWSQYGTSLTVGGGRPMLPLVLVPFVRRDPQVAAVLSLAFLVPPALSLVVAARAGGHRRDRRRAARAEAPIAARGESTPPNTVIIATTAERVQPSESGPREGAGDGPGRFHRPF